MSDFVYNDSELQMNSNLILCIEEYDSMNYCNSIDTRLFIGWNDQDAEFFIRGKRLDIGLNEFVPYAFHCNSTNDLYDFIKIVVGPERNKSVTLYNFNNLHDYHNNIDYSELTYEFFEQHMDRNYEIVAYDNVKISRSEIKKYLNILKKMYK